MKEIKLENNEIELIKGLLNGREDKLSKSVLKRLNKAQSKIKVSSAKAKGRNLQYWVCERIASIFNVEFNQNDDNSLIQSRPMGQHNVDIILRGEVYDKFKYDIECKAQENLAIADWIKQAKENTKKGRDWLLVFKKKSIGESCVCFSWYAFERLIKEIF